MEEKKETPFCAGQKIIILAGRRRGSSHLMQQIIKLLDVPEDERLFIDAFDEKAEIKPHDNTRLVVIDHISENFQRCTDCLMNPKLTVVIQMGHFIVSHERLEELLSFSYLLIMAGTHLEKNKFDLATKRTNPFFMSKIQRQLEKLDRYEFLIIYHKQYQAYPALPFELS